MPYFQENRLFKRYRLAFDFIIIIEATSYKASTVDFSLSGLCLFVEGHPPLSMNSTIDIRIEELELDVKGKIVWLKRTGNNLLVGIEKMSVSGLLKHYHLSDILLDLQRSDATGALEIKYGLLCKQVYFADGILVFATSNQKEDRIEEVLLEAGKLTTDQYYQFISMTAENKGHQGKVFSEMGFLKPHDFFLAIKQQAEKIILDLFSQEDSVVTFREGPLPENIVRLKLSAADLIFRGIKRINKTAFFKKISPPLDTVLYYSGDPLNLFQDIHFTEADKYVLSLMNGRLTIKELLSASSLGNFNTARIICALLVTRMIEVKEKGTLDDRSLIDIIGEPLSHADETLLKRIEEAYVNCQSMDYYSILGVDRNVSHDDIRKAYFRNAKEFHPDRHFSMISIEMKNKLSIIFTHNTIAYKTLSDEQEKRKYDATLAMMKPEVEKKDNKAIARQKYSQGREAFGKGLSGEAFELLGQAVYFDNSVADYHFYFGLAYQRQNRLREAVKEIGLAIKLEPHNADYLAEIGHIYVALGFPLRAKSAFEKAIQLKASHARAAAGLDSLRQLLKK